MLNHWVKQRNLILKQAVLKNLAYQPETLTIFLDCAPALTSQLVWLHQYSTRVPCFGSLFPVNLPCHSSPRAYLSGEGATLFLLLALHRNGLSFSFHHSYPSSGFLILSLVHQTPAKVRNPTSCHLHICLCVLHQQHPSANYCPMQATCPTLALLDGVINDYSLGPIRWAWLPLIKVN